MIVVVYTIPVIEQLASYYCSPTVNSTQKKDKTPPPTGSPDTERDQTVYDVFRSHYSQLVRGITQTNLLAGDLFSKGLISEAVKNDVTSVTGVGIADRANTLMNAVGARLKGDPRPAQVMRELCEVMETEPALRPVCSSIRTALGESGKVVY